MKTPAATEITASAPNSANSIGHLPQRQDTVTAEVLRRLLEGERLTSLAGVYEASTTRLGAVVFSLRESHGWICDTRDKAAACRDGRVAWVTEYRLCEAQRLAAVQCPEALKWCRQVREARAKRRTEAAQAAHRAAVLNAALAVQRDLFGEGGHAH